MTNALKKFTKPIAPDDYEDLLNTIYYLKEVRDRQYQIDDMWEPIKVIIIENIINIKYIKSSIIVWFLISYKL